jgi:hypothetical protein
MATATIGNHMQLRTAGITTNNTNPTVLHRRGCLSCAVVSVWLMMCQPCWLNRANSWRNKARPSTAGAGLAASLGDGVMVALVAAGVLRLRLQDWHAASDS